jgi:hypothetical protein
VNDNHQSAPHPSLPRKRRESRGPGATVAAWVLDSRFGNDECSVLMILKFISDWCLDVSDTVPPDAEKEVKTVLGLDLVAYSVSPGFLKKIKTLRRLKIGSIEFRMGDVARGKRLGANTWS